VRHSRVRDYSTRSLEEKSKASSARSLYSTMRLSRMREYRKSLKEKYFGNSAILLSMECAEELLIVNSSATFLDSSVRLDWTRKYGVLQRAGIVSAVQLSRMLEYCI